MLRNDRDTSWDDVFALLLLWLAGIVLCIVIFAVLFVAMAFEQANITQTSGEENLGYYTDGSNDIEASESVDFIFSEESQMKLGYDGQLAR